MGGSWREIATYTVGWQEREKINRRKALTEHTGQVTPQLREGGVISRGAHSTCKGPEVVFRKDPQSREEEALAGVVSSEAISDSLEQTTFPPAQADLSSDFSCAFPSVHSLTSDSSDPKVVRLPQSARYLQLCCQLSISSQTLAELLTLPASFSCFHPFCGGLSRPWRKPGCVVE